jgi:hypothetical protein
VDPAAVAATAAIEAAVVAAAIVTNRLSLYQIVRIGDKFA